MLSARLKTIPTSSVCSTPTEPESLNRCTTPATSAPQFRLLMPSFLDMKADTWTPPETTWCTSEPPMRPTIQSTESSDTSSTREESTTAPEMCSTPCTMTPQDHLL